MDNNKWIDFWINIAAELTLIVFFGFIGFIIYLYYLRDRKGILSFFGIQDNRPNTTIYLSTLQVKPGGTEGIEPIGQGYSGSAISKIEYDAGLLIQKELQSKPLALLPSNIQDWLGQKTVELKELNIPILLSPKSQNLDISVFDNNLIIIGTGVYNSLSYYYLNKYLPKYYDKNYYSRYFYNRKEANGQRIICIRERGIRDIILEGRDSGSESAFIQRIIDRDYGITVFICAGLGSSATFGSTRYLAENWKSLQQKFRNTEFGIGLIFRNQNQDEELGTLIRSPDVVLKSFSLRDN